MRILATVRNKYLVALGFSGGTSSIIGQGKGTAYRRGFQSTNKYQHNSATTKLLGFDVKNSGDKIWRLSTKTVWVQQAGAMIFDNHTKNSVGLRL